MEGQVLDAAAKALSINLDKTIYGAFAEIGAGQEIARNFFVVGGYTGKKDKLLPALCLDVMCFIELINFITFFCQYLH